MDKSTNEINPAKPNDALRQSFVNYSDKNAAAIQHEIHLTRAEMDETVSAIQARISPQHLMNQAVEMAREAVRSGAPRLVRAIQENPLPTALVAIGLGWLFVKTAEGAVEQKARSQGFYPGAPEGRYGLDELGHQAGEAADHIKDTAGRIAGQARQTAGHLAEATWDKAGDLAEATREKAGEVVHQARQQAGRLGQAARTQLNRAGNQVNELFRESPLAIGALCLGVGAALALGLPATRPEQELMGEAAGSVIEQARQTGQQTLEKIGHVAEAGQNAIKEEAQHEDLI